MADVLQALELLVGLEEASNQVKLVIAAGVTLASWFVLQRLTRASTTSKGTSPDLKVSALYIYPIKGCAGTKLLSVSLDRLGFEHDRRFMIVDKETKVFVSQREVSAMALIKPTVDDDSLTLNAPDMEELVVDCDTMSSEKVQVSVWDDKVDVVTVSEVADVWLSKYLKTEVMLVATISADSHTRPIGEKYFKNEENKNVAVAFSDGFPFLLLTDGSLEDINNRVPSISVNSLARSFRPNVVISGARPWEEDGWKQIKIGDVLMDVCKACSRCQVPAIDPDTGTRRSRYEPIKTLNTYRSVDNTVYVGQNSVHLNQGIVSIDDVVQVLELKEPKFLM